MKVVFLEDVPKVARAGEVKEVADGYGRNFLIPQKLALLPTPEVMSRVDAQRRGETRKKAETEAQLVQIAKELDGREVTFKAKVGAKGRLYGRVTSTDIAAELEKTAGVAVDKRKIELAEPIRELGSYEVLIRLGRGIIPKIKVTVAEEEAP